MRQINKIIVHCAATREGRDFTVEDITRWHKARGFATIGYHYVIYRDGSIHEGRPLEQIGAHCVGHNKHSIGICYIGGCASYGKTPKDTRTPEQKEAMLSLLRRLKAQFPNATIHGHRDFVAKACPSFDATSEFRSLAVTILLAFSCMLFSSCRSKKHVVEEKADVAVQQAVSQSATSLTTDKFLQNIVLHIDSIVFTPLSVPQVSEADDSTGHIDTASSISGTISSCTESNRTSRSSPNKVGTKVVISGISLQATTADSSSTATAVSSESNLQASDRSLAKNKEVNKPSSNNLRWLYLILFISIAIAVILALLRYRSSIWATVRFVLRKVIT